MTPFFEVCMADAQIVDLDMCERGNNLFVTDDGDLFFIAELSKGNWLQVSYHSSNYPAFTLNTIQATEQEVATHINENLLGWYARKCNLDGVHLAGDYVSELIGAEDA
jgi:hypothetical protein